MSFNFQNGYIGSQMSVRAVHAYEEGFKPLSKWTKTELVEILNQIYDNKYDFRKIKKNVLFEHFLSYSEWHHTGKFYNHTSFYGIDECSIEAFNEEEYEVMLKLSSEKKETVPEKQTRFVKVHYKQWSGSRRHPKADEIYEFGYIKGDWFNNLTGGRKKVSGNWFEVIKEYAAEADMLAEKAEEDAAEQKKAEEDSAKAAALKEKKEAAEERKRLYQAYITVYPDTTMQKFCRNKAMMDEARNLLNDRLKDYKAELNDLLQKRQHHEITKIEYRELRKQIKNKYRSILTKEQHLN